MKMFVLISQMIWTHPTNWGPHFLGVKLTKTEGDMIVSGLEKAHNIIFKNQKVLGKQTLTKIGPFVFNF